MVVTNAFTKNERKDDNNSKSRKRKERLNEIRHRRSDTYKYVYTQRAVHNIHTRNTHEPHPLKILFSVAFDESHKVLKPSLKIKPKKKKTKPGT